MALTQEKFKMILSTLNITENDVVYEEYEDEMIFLHLKNGYYYTLTNEGADCVIALLRSASVDEAFTWLKEKYETDETSLHSYCKDLVTELIQEELVHERKDKQTDDGILDGFSGVPKKLQSYHLDKYEDIQDILKFDPVHEVNEDGWPSVIE